MSLEKKKKPISIREFGQQIENEKDKTDSLIQLIRVGLTNKDPLLIKKIINEGVRPVHVFLLINQTFFTPDFIFFLKEISVEKDIHYEKQFVHSTIRLIFSSLTSADYKDIKLLLDHLAQFEDKNELLKIAYTALMSVQNVNIIRSLCKYDKDNVWKTAYPVSEFLQCIDAYAKSTTKNKTLQFVTNQSVFVDVLKVSLFMMVYNKEYLPSKEHFEAYMYLCMANEDIVKQYLKKDYNRRLFASFAIKHYDHFEKN